MTLDRQNSAAPIFLRRDIKAQVQIRLAAARMSDVNVGHLMSALDVFPSDVALGPDTRQRVSYLLSRVQVVRQDPRYYTDSALLALESHLHQILHQINSLHM